jgi:DNA polymerase V
MGAPAFKWREFFKKHDIVAFSGNFELYGDMSRRVTSILTTVTPRIELYSIDESFLDISQLQIDDITAWAREVQARVRQWTGIPISVGIAPTKTLAKLASERGKRSLELDGVLDLYSDPSIRRQYMEGTKLEDVWGVGRRLSPRLRGEGIANAWDLSQMNLRHAQQMMGIQGRRMVSELNGLTCYRLEKFGKPQQSISVTRTFGNDTKQLHVLESAIATFTTKAAFRLREGKQLAKSAGIFIATNQHKPGFTSRSRKIQFDLATADTGRIAEALMGQLKSMFNPKAEYHRAGVWLGDLAPQGNLQIDLLGTIDPSAHDKSQRSMEALDNLNERYGKRTVHYAAEDLDQTTWQPRHKIAMPRFTTRWDEIPIVSIR